MHTLNALIFIQVFILVYLRICIRNNTVPSLLVIL